MPQNLFSIYSIHSRADAYLEIEKLLPPSLQNSDFNYLDVSDFQPKEQENPFQQPVTTVKKCLLEGTNTIKKCLPEATNTIKKCLLEDDKNLNVKPDENLKACVISTYM